MAAIALSGTDDGLVNPVEDILVGKDVLELPSTAMYVDPRTLYREYTQNAADGIDEASAFGLLDSGRGRIDIYLDPLKREIRIRDNGAGVPSEEASHVLMALGSSRKRGKRARGFRGVGRLAGLGFCQYLTFRTRNKSDSNVIEVRWDCRRLKTILRDAYYSGDLQDVVREVVTLRKVHDPEAPAHFFEVHLEKVVRIKNDVLLNAAEVVSYLSQVGPVPMPAEFEFAPEIEKHLGAFVPRPQFDIVVQAPSRQGAEEDSSACPC